MALAGGVSVPSNRDSIATGICGVGEIVGVLLSDGVLVIVGVSDIVGVNDIVGVTLIVGVSDGVTDGEYTE